MSRGCVLINRYIRKGRCNIGSLVKSGFSPLIAAFRLFLRKHCVSTVKMKILLVVVALLVVIERWTEAHPGWPTYPDFQNRRGNNPGRGPPWGYPQRIENQNNGFSSDVEWVCQNPRTNDIMIIASDDTRHTPQHYPSGGPWQWHNVPPGHQKEHHSHGNHWTQPIIIIQETPNTDNNQTPPPLPTSTEIPNNNNDKQTQQPPYHGGEGSIDIRVGAE